MSAPLIQTGGGSSNANAVITNPSADQTIAGAHALVLDSGRAVVGSAYSLFSALTKGVALDPSVFPIAFSAQKLGGSPAPVVALQGISQGSGAYGLWVVADTEDTDGTSSSPNNLINTALSSTVNYSGGPVGLEVNVEAYPASGKTMTYAYGLYTFAYNLAAGTVNTLASQIASGNTNSGGGSVHNSYGFYSDIQSGVGDTLNAGFYSADQGSGANDYALYIAGGKSRVGSQGVLFPGSTSGTATIVTPAAAGTPTLTLPTSTGTFALTSQLPSTLANASHKWLNSYDSSTGLFTQTQPAFTDISGSVAASQLPNPSSSTLGGIQSAAAVSHQWIDSISTSGVPHLSQPAFTDVSGAATNAQLPNGLTNFNTAAQSQVVVSGTTYYITSSNINLPASPVNGIVIGTTFRWRIVMTKTAAGTGTFQIVIFMGTNGTTADTATVTQTLGTGTAIADTLYLDVQLTFTAVGSGTGSFFWSIAPINKSGNAGFTVANSTGFTGTVSSLTTTTSNLKFGLGFIQTTGTPTMNVLMVQAYAHNLV